MVWLILLMKKNCPWNCRTLKTTNRDRKEKGLWQIFLNGFINTPQPGEVGRGPWRRTRCLAMQEAVGTSFATWIHRMKKNFAPEKFLITGDRLIFISEERNMRLDIYYTVVFGQSFCMTVDGSVTKSLIKDW